MAIARAVLRRDMRGNRDFLAREWEQDEHPVCRKHMNKVCFIRRFCDLHHGIRMARSGYWLEGQLPWPPYKDPHKVGMVERRLFLKQPVLRLQARKPGKVLDIVGHKGHAERDCVGRYQFVEMVLFLLACG